MRTASLLSASTTLFCGAVVWRGMRSNTVSERWIGPLLCLAGLAQMPMFVWGPDAYAAQATAGTVIRLVLGLVLLHTALQRAIAQASRLGDQYERLTVNSHQGVTVGYAQQIIYCNPAFLKIYGVTSVLLQAFFDVEYLFDVGAESFTPPPKVESGVIRLTPRKASVEMRTEKSFFTLVKTAFGQRRKTLRNAVKPLFSDEELKDPLFNRRPEQLAVREFAALTFRMK